MSTPDEISAACEAATVLGLSLAEKGEPFWHAVFKSLESDLGWSLANEYQLHVIDEIRRQLQP